MQNFVSEWFSNRPVFSEIKIEGIVFPIATLTEEVKELIEMCETSKEMLNMAADNALTHNRARIIEGVYAEDIALFWEQSEVNTGSEPSIKEQLGELVIKSNGLSEILADKIASEEETHIDGDDISDETLNTTLGALTADRTHAA